MNSTDPIHEFITQLKTFLKNEACFHAPLSHTESTKSYFSWPPHGLFIYLVQNDDDVVVLTIHQSVDRRFESLNLTLSKEDISRFFIEKAQPLRTLFPKPSFLKHFQIIFSDTDLVLSLACSRSMIHYKWCQLDKDRGEATNHIYTDDYTYEILKGENITGIYLLLDFPKVNFEWVPCLVEENIVLSERRIALERIVNHNGKWKQIFNLLSS